MKKIILRTIILISLLFSFSIMYLSTIGIKTNKLNNQISDQIKNINENLEIKLKDVSIILDPLNLKLNIKTIGPSLSYNKKIIELEKIKSGLSIKSLINKKFSLKELNISTKSIEVKNMIIFIRALTGNSKLYVTEKLIKKGFIIANVNIAFDESGNIKNNYQIKGNIKDGKLSFFKDYDVSKIDFNFDIRNEEFNLNRFKLSLNDKNFFYP